MYRKLFYIAFFICTLSQVNYAELMEHCRMCQELGACPNAESNSSDTFLKINIDNNTNINEPFAIGTTPSENIFNIFQSCDTNSKLLVTWNRKQLHDFAQLVKANLDNKIVFSNKSCFTIKDIKDKTKELNEKLNTLKNGIDVLRINITGSVGSDDYGLRRVGKNSYQIFENCNNKKNPKKFFRTKAEAQKELDKIVKRLSITIEIPLGAGECKLFTEIATMIKEKMIELYPEAEPKINAAVAPPVLSSTPPLGVMKSDYVYMKVETCESTKKREDWNDAEEVIKTWADKYVTAMKLGAD